MYYLEHLGSDYLLKKTDINDSEKCGSKAVHTSREDFYVGIVELVRIEEDSV